MCICALALFLTATPERNSQARPTLGSVGTVVGQVDLISSGKTLKATNGLNLSLGDQLITGKDSKAYIHSNPSFWLMPGSKLLWLGTAEEPTAQLVRGEIQKKNAADQEDNKFSLVRLVHNGEEITGDFFSSYRQILKTKSESIVTVDTGKEWQDVPTAPTTKREKQIFETFALYKRFFQTCLLKQYQETNGHFQGSNTVFQFMILPNGNIDDLRISKNNTDNTQYTQCLKDVMARVHFKNLKVNKPIAASLPLQLQL